MSVPPACPNCAWAMKMAHERKLPATARWVFTNIAELVNRHTLEFSGRSCIAILADYTGLNRRTIQFALKNIPSDLVSITAGAGTHYVFKLLRPQSPIYESDSQREPEPTNQIRTADPETTNQIRSDPEPTNQIRSAYESDSQQTAPDYESDSQNPLSKNPLKNPPESPPPPPASGGGARRARVREDDRFDEFWKDYPKKLDKGDAYKAYVAALKAIGGDPDDLLDALFEAKQEDSRFLGDPKWTPYPASWLRAGPWHAPKPKVNGGGEAAHAH